jgi:hypothetical protein
MVIVSMGLATDAIAVVAEQRPVNRVGKKSTRYIASQASVAAW